MRLVYTLFSFVLCCFALNAQVEVVFGVDMNVEPASAEGVFVTGNWMDDAGLGGEWQEPGSNMDAQLTDPDGDGIFTLSVMLPAGEYQYKYSNGIGWPNGEAGGGGDNYQADLSGCDGVDNGFGGWNRTFTVSDESMLLTFYEFNSCNVAVSSTRNFNHAAGLTLSPNPASGIVSLIYDNTDFLASDLTLTNAAGQVVRKLSNLPNANQQIDVAGLPAGLYVLRLRDAKGQQGFQKLIVR